MAEIKINALMLRATDYGENDKILTLLSAERGRVTAGIKGVKKSGAKLRFAAQPFCFAEYILAVNGSRYTVTQASESESFYELRCDIGKFYAACSVCEAAAALTVDGEPCEDIFSAALKALRDMCSSDERAALISFLISALKCSGYGLALNRYCPVCGALLTGAAKLKFDMNAANFFCYDCGAGAGVSGVTFGALLNCRNGGGGCAPESGKGELRALKLLHEYLVRKTETRFVSLSQYIAFLETA